MKFESCSLKSGHEISKSGLLRRAVAARRCGVNGAWCRAVSEDDEMGSNKWSQKGLVTLGIRLLILVGSI